LPGSPNLKRPGQKKKNRMIENLPAKILKEITFCSKKEK